MEQPLGAVIGCSMLVIGCWMFSFCVSAFFAFENDFKADASDRCRCESKSRHHGELEAAGGFKQLLMPVATAAKAAKLGGKIMMPPFDVPEVGRIAVLLDPQGAAFGLFKSA